MNILFVTHVSSLYGANRSMLDILESLDRKKFNVYVVGPDKGVLNLKLRTMEIPYFVISMALSVHYTEPIGKIIEKNCRNLTAVKQIVSIIREKKIDIVHTNSSVINVGAVAAWITNTRHIWHIRELDIQYGYKRDCNLWDNFFMRKSESVLCISKYVRSELLKHYRGKNILIYRDPIDVKNYNIFRKEIFLFDCVTILCCGVLTENKKQLTVVKALKMLREQGVINLKLVIVGSGGSYAKQVQKYIMDNQMQGYVEMHPFCEDLTEYRKNADIAIMSSVNEALGRVTIESMLSELVLIGAASGATEELIRDGYNGLKYNPDSEYDLAKKIKYVIQHKEEAAFMVRNAKKFALLQFDAGKRIKKLERLYLGKGQKLL